MSVATALTDERINLRLKQNAKQTLERAASFEGQTVSKFVLSIALAHAEKTIKEHEQMHLNAQDADAFFNALSAPAPFNQKLKTAIADHDARVTYE